MPKRKSTSYNDDVAIDVEVPGAKAAEPSAVSRSSIRRFLRGEKRLAMREPETLDPARKMLRSFIDRLMGGELPENAVVGQVPDLGFGVGIGAASRLASVATEEGVAARLANRFGAGLEEGSKVARVAGEEGAVSRLANLAAKEERGIQKIAGPGVRVGSGAAKAGEEVAEVATRRGAKAAASEASSAAQRRLSTDPSVVQRRLPGPPKPANVSASEAERLREVVGGTKAGRAGRAVSKVGSAVKAVGRGAKKVPGLGFLTGLAAWEQLNPESPLNVVNKLTGPSDEEIAKAKVDRAVREQASERASGLVGERARGIINRQSQEPNPFVDPMELDAKIDALLHRAGLSPDKGQLIREIGSTMGPAGAARATDALTIQPNSVISMLSPGSDAGQESRILRSQLFELMRGGRRSAPSVPAANPADVEELATGA